MPGRLAVDFGTSNTVVALWSDADGEAIPTSMPEFSQAPPHGNKLPLVPSVIHYGDDGLRWIGNQVLQRNLVHHKSTFRWMKQYIANRSPIKKTLAGKKVSHFDAGGDFLSALLTSCVQDFGLTDEEVVLTVPVESFEHYDQWLANSAVTAGLERFRFVDEPSAAAMGYGAHIQPGDVYMIFDFGGGTLDVAVVMVEEEMQESGRCCRILGKAGSDIGGSTVDQWLYQWVLDENGKQAHDSDVREISNMLLHECQHLKEKLSFEESGDITVVNPSTGSVISATMTRRDFEDLMDEKDALASVDRTIRRALAAATERGYDDSKVQSVMMVGGSLIPCVQQTVRRIFGRERVALDRPMDAVARGAAALASGFQIHDHIQHDYAIRFANPQKGDHDYRVIVERGISYPSEEPVARLTIKASHDGQTKFGLALFEISQHQPVNASGRMELIFDDKGAARMVEVSANDAKNRSHFWMNKDNQTFLSVDRHVQRGERCFQVAFSIDHNKHLLVSATDLQSNNLVLNDFPVIKLN